MLRISILTMLLLTVVSRAGAQEEPPPPARQLTPANAAALNAPPANVVELMRRSNGSLFRATELLNDDPRVIKPSDVSYFAVPAPKPKTLMKHDLVTIVVSEESESSSDATTDLKKDAGIDAKLSQFPVLKLGNFAVGNGIGTVVPELNLTGNRNYKGSGTVDRKDSVTTRIQAEVVDVKPNGTLVLQARKRIVTDEEEQLFVLTGICRVQDITPDNTVLSTQLYDCDFHKNTSGAVRDSTKRGWVPRVLDWINPF